MLENIKTNKDRALAKHAQLGIIVQTLLLQSDVLLKILVKTSIARVAKMLFRTVQVELSTCTINQTLQMIVKTAHQAISVLT